MALSQARLFRKQQAQTTLGDTPVYGPVLECVVDEKNLEQSMKSTTQDSYSLDDRDFCKRENVQPKVSWLLES